jgi:hypothetical protein
MAKIDRNCFICNKVLQAPAESKLISGGQIRRAKKLFILLQRVLDLPDLRSGSDQSEIVEEIWYCNSCVDELEGIKNVLDAFDKLKKIVERRKKEIQSIFMENGEQEIQVKSTKGPHQGVTEFRSQLVDGN